VGRLDHWTVIDVNTNRNLQGVCHFGGGVFVCTDFELYRVENGSLVAETRFANNDEPETCMNLIAGRNSLFSQGERDLFRFDGNIWTRVF